MPELPDVEGFRRVLAKHARAGRIREVVVRDTGVLRGTNSRSLARALRGRRFLSPQRHGKWLIARTDGRAIVVFHFGMTGVLVWRSAGTPAQRFDHVVFVIDGGELRYNDMRKLHGLWLLREERALERILARLGPDALKVSEQVFEQRIARRGRLKAVLADQSVIAGLGNLLVDEILWRARINPLRSARSLGAQERNRLYAEMRRVLRASIPTGRVPPRPTWLTGRRDRPGGKCPRCGAKLARRRIAGRTTVWCPRCQRKSGST